MSSDTPGPEGQANLPAQPMHPAPPGYPAGHQPAYPQPFSEAAPPAHPGYQQGYPQQGYPQQGYPQAPYELRRRNLSQAVQNEVVGGWRVESQSDDSAVLVKGGATNHTLHLILTILTCGMWGLVWIFMPLINQRRTVVLRVDEYGNVLRQG